MGQWEPLLWLGASLCLLLLVTRWFSQRVANLAMLLTGDQKATLYVYFVLFFPGVLLHELSHWLAAKLLGVRTGSLELGPRMVAGGVVQLGAVNYVRPDFIRESLIGLAPLISGTAVVMAVASRRFGLLPPQAIVAQQVLLTMRQVLSSQHAWIWLYLILAVSNAMLPSAADRRSWGILVLVVLGVVVLLYAAGIAPQMPPPMLSWLLLRARELAFAFGLAVLFDLIVGGTLWLAEALLGRLLGRRVGYG